MSKIYFEEGKKCVFAVSLEWPGWCRRAKTAELALDALVDYIPRYEAIVSVPFTPGDFEVVGTLTGNATTDFGALDARGPWDNTPLTTRERTRQLAILGDCWNYFDLVIDNAPSTLARGPRGGGRDTEAIVEHVRESERAYCSRAGFRVPPRTPWDEQRDVVVTTLNAAPTNAKWPTAYAIRRIAWHMVDHAWEIEDKGA